MCGKSASLTKQLSTVRQQFETQIQSLNKELNRFKDMADEEELAAKRAANTGSDATRTRTRTRPPGGTRAPGGKKLLWFVQVIEIYLAERDGMIMKGIEP